MLKSIQDSPAVELCEEAASSSPVDAVSPVVAVEAEDVDAVEPVAVEAVVALEVDAVVAVEVEPVRLLPEPELKVSAKRMARPPSSSRLLAHPMTAAAKPTQKAYLMFCLKLI